MSISLPNELGNDLTIRQHIAFEEICGKTFAAPHNEADATNQDWLESDSETDDDVDDEPCSVWGWLSLYEQMRLRASSFRTAVSKSFVSQHYRFAKR
jgi:hypothetical protein